LQFEKKISFFKMRMLLSHQIYTWRPTPMTDMVWDCFVVLIVFNKSVSSFFHSILGRFEAIKP
jgi:hypothetical protein